MLILGCTTVQEEANKLFGHGRRSHFANGAWLIRFSTHPGVGLGGFWGTLKFKNFAEEGNVVCSSRLARQLDVGCRWCRNRPRRRPSRLPWPITVAAPRVNTISRDTKLMIFDYLELLYWTILKSCYDLANTIEYGSQVRWRRWNGHFKGTFAHSIHGQISEQVDQVVMGSWAPNCRQGKQIAVAINRLLAIQQMLFMYVNNTRRNAWYVLTSNSREFDFGKGGKEDLDKGDPC